jgi:mannose-1-phosphate guanylyltransferase
MPEVVKIVEDDFYEAVHRSTKLGSKLLNLGTSPLFKNITPLSLDRSIIEQCKLHVVIGKFNFHDLGTWGNVWNNNHRDPNNNVIEGRVFTNNVKNSLIQSDALNTIVLGLDNVIVINNGTNLLVAHKSCVDQVQDAIPFLLSKQQDSSS